MKNKLKILVLLVVTLTVSACGSDTLPEPVGIGEAIDDLKRSPCACLEVEQDYSDWT